MTQDKDDWKDDRAALRLALLVFRRYFVAEETVGRQQLRDAVKVMRKYTRKANQDAEKR